MKQAIKSTKINSEDFDLTALLVCYLVTISSLHHNSTPRVLYTHQMDKSNAECYRAIGSLIIITDAQGIGSIWNRTNSSSVN